MPVATDQASGEAELPPQDKVMLFSQHADLFDRFAKIVDGPEAPVYRWLDEHLRGGRRALDVGCGTGRYTVMLADRYDGVVGVDAAPEMIKIAERDRPRPNLRYQTRDVLSMTPEKDGLFDAVLALSCIFHIGLHDEVLARLRHLIAPGGILLIVEPQRPPNWGSEGWQADLAFGAARAAFDTTGDIEDVAAVLQLMLSPRWLEANKTSVPLTREQFHRTYSAALPAVTIDEEDGLFGFFLASWRAPAS